MPAPLDQQVCPQKAILMIGVYAMVCFVTAQPGPAQEAGGHRSAAGPPERGAVGTCPTEAACRAAYVELLRRVNEVLAEAALLQLPVEKRLPFELRYDRSYRAQLGVLGRCSGSRLEVSFLGPSCTPIYLYNWLACPSQGGKGVLYDGPPPASWSRDKAIGIASKLLRAFVGEERAKLVSLSTARHNYPLMQRGRYYAGEWAISWFRTDPAGHEFTQDAAGVFLTEEAGLSGIRLNWYSRYEAKPGKVIEQNRARAEARPLAAKILTSPAAVWYLENYTLLELKAAALKIVNPNHILEMKSVEDFANLGDIEAKLAWVVTFPARYAGSVPQGERMPVERQVDVWLDAHTAEFLGGEFR